MTALASMIGVAIKRRNPTAAVVNAATDAVESMATLLDQSDRLIEALEGEVAKSIRVDHLEAWLETIEAEIPNFTQPEYAPGWEQAVTHLRMICKVPARPEMWP